MISVYEPYIPLASKRFVDDAIKTGWISSKGSYINKCEKFLSDYLGVKHVILMANGTCANSVLNAYISNLMNGTMLVPNNVYVAAWNTIDFSKFKLLPVDASPITWNVNLKALDDAMFSNPVDVILVVHNLGNIVDVPALQRKYPNKVIIEDACEGLFGKYDSTNTNVGSAAFGASLSFYANKIITAGEGGAVVTNNDYLAEFARKYIGQGQSNKRFIHDTIGFNYRMTNIQAAMLYGQLMELDSILSAKKAVFDNYDYLIKTLDTNRVVPQRKNSTPANWMYGIRVINGDYDTAEKFFASKGIEIRPMFYPMSFHTHLKFMANPEQELVAKILSEECIILPSHPQLSFSEQEIIIDTLEQYYDSIQ